MTIEQRLHRMGLTSVTVIEKEITVSTNTDCREYAARFAPSHPILITAEEQTGGRGRQGKTFSSEKGGLYMTLLTKPEAEISRAVRCTAAAAERRRGTGGTSRTGAGE